VEAFEAEWAGWCGVEQAVGCANGTDALELILRSLDLPAGSRPERCQRTTSSVTGRKRWLGQSLHLTRGFSHTPRIHSLAQAGA
jgi:hypothetical protein